jgi:hypothetical protein
MRNTNNSLWPGDMPDPDNFDQHDDWEDDSSVIDDLDDEELELDKLDADNDDDISITADEEE